MDTNNWNAGIEDELVFWREWLAAKGKIYERLGRLSDKFTLMIGNKKKVRIANLGAGPVCLIGDYRRDVDVTVVSSDVLANEYRKLLKELHIKPANPVKKQDMTKLTYRNNTFDIVYCGNALDHCPDPYKALREMVRVCKPGGWIYLWHVAHEGQRQRYRGLHKWNIDRMEDGNCIIWNNNPGKQQDAFLLSDIYPGFQTTLQPRRQGALITSVVQKHA